MLIVKTYCLENLLKQTQKNIFRDLCSIYFNLNKMQVSKEHGLGQNGENRLNSFLKVI